MERAEIERYVARRVREAAEAAARDAIREVNARGHRFAPVEDLLMEWREPGAREALSVHCAIGVGMSPVARARRSPDPAVEAFVALAESGKDREASVLNLLEGDVANGGFAQLFDNKGVHFVERAAALLVTIGARKTARVVRRALKLVRDNEAVVRDHRRLQKALGRLDERFFAAGESIAELFARHRAGPRG